MKINSASQSVSIINNNLRKDEKKGIKDTFSSCEDVNIQNKQFLMKPSFKTNIKELVQEGLDYKLPVLAGGTAGFCIAGAGIAGKLCSEVPALSIFGVAVASVLAGVATFKAAGWTGSSDAELKSNLKTGLAGAGLALGCAGLSVVSAPLAMATGFVAGAAKFVHDAREMASLES